MKQLLIEEDSSVQLKPCSDRKKRALKFVMNFIYPTCIIVPTVLIIKVCWSNGMGSLYSWHLLLTVIGFHLIMPAAISSLHVQLRLPYYTCTNKTLHWLLQSIASACVLIGVALQYINRDMKDKPHFGTVHSIVGLLSVVLVIVSLASGGVTLLGWNLRKFVRIVWLYRIHRAVGAAGFSAGMVGLALAYDKRILKESFSEETRQALTIAACITVLLSLVGVLKKISTVCANVVSNESVLSEV